MGSESKESEETFDEEIDDAVWEESARLAELAYIQQAGGTVSDERTLGEASQQFKLFCKRQIESNAQGWDIESTLPWRTDAILCKTVDQSIMSRKQATAVWKQLRRAHGSLDKIEVQGSVDDYVQSYNAFCTENMQSICTTALTNCGARFEVRNVYNEKMKEATSTVFDEKLLLKEIIRKYLQLYNSLLAESIVGMSIDNRAVRQADFLKRRFALVDDRFLPLCVVPFPGFDDVIFREIFVSLNGTFLTRGTTK